MSTVPIIDEVLQYFGPEPEGLLRAICLHMTDDMLEQIASADYGTEFECHLARLRVIRETAAPPAEMEWCPSEVLELMRWSQPEDAAWKPGATGLRGHWIRAFCCAVLLRALREPSNYDIGTGNEITLINFILSARELPIELNSPATGLLAWLLLKSDLEGQDTDVCAFGIGLLWFTLQTARSSTNGTVRDIPENALMALAHWICRRSTELYPELIMGSDRLPIRMGTGNPPPSGWQKLGQLICELDLSRYSSPLREIVEEIGLQLAE